MQAILSGVFLASGDWLVELLRHEAEEADQCRDLSTETGTSEAFAGPASQRSPRAAHCFLLRPHHLNPPLSKSAAPPPPRVAVLRAHAFALASPLFAIPVPSCLNQCACFTEPEFEKDR